MADLDRVAAGVDVDVAAGAENQRHTPRTNGSAGSAALETGGVARIADTASVTKDTADAPADLNPGEDRSPGEDDNWNGQRRACPSRQESSGKRAPGGHQKKLNGPKNTAKHIEAKQNWINMESKRIEAESATLVEMQENLRARKETFECCLRGKQDSPSRPVARGRIDRKKTGATSCLQRARRKFGISNNKELNLWRGTASKRLAGWTRDGSTEEIAVEAKKRKVQETIEKKSSV